MSLLEATHELGGENGRADHEDEPRRIHRRLLGAHEELDVRVLTLVHCLAQLVAE
jgi:hypothetical protein